MQRPKRWTYIERGRAEYNGRIFFGETSDEAAELHYLRDYKRWADQRLKGLVAFVRGVTASGSSTQQQPLSELTAPVTSECCFTAAEIQGLLNCPAALQLVIDHYHVQEAEAEATGWVECLKGFEERRKVLESLRDSLQVARGQRPGNLQLSGDYGDATRSGAKSAVPPGGDWLWGKLMQWCRQRRVSPSEYSDLFAIVAEARTDGHLEPGSDYGPSR